MEKPLPIPSGNIFWKEIKPEDTVVERETVFVVNGTHVANWQSIDAREAQLWLKRKASLDARRTLPNASDADNADFTAAEAQRLKNRL